MRPGGAGQVGLKERVWVKVSCPKIINHFGLSGGKDSTALWGWAINDSGYPVESIRGSFSDTENEYQAVYDQIAALDAYGQKHGVAPVETLKSEGFLALCIRKKRFPSARARFCTEELKIKPFIRWCEARQAEGHQIVAHSGVRRDESTERSLLPEWDTKTYKTKPPLVVRLRRPLLDWSIEAVWAAHKKYGLPINPLYFEGRKRVGCKLCCMSNKDDVRVTALRHPETISLYREWERIVGEHSNTKAAAMEGQVQKSHRSFFPASTVPQKCCSLHGFIRARDGTRGKKGETYSACTIDDVVAWSMTLRGGQQRGFEFMFEEDDAHLPCQSGYCE